MAFNPFTSFRKHKKVLFAALTILCMFTFVLSSGVAGFGRDFFTELPRWFGMGRGSNKIVKVNGSWVRERDLIELRARRELALGTIVGANRNAAQMMMFDDMRKGQQQSKRAQDLSQLSFPYMFAQASVSKPEDLLDFIMWKGQADRLGINLNDAAVDTLFGRLTDSQFTLNAIATGVLQNARERGLSVADLRSAIADEFRVMLAREALLGKEFDFSMFNPMGGGDNLVQTPTLVTPEAFWNYFKENLTALNLEVLPVAVNTFHTTKEPTEYDLKVLYNQYKDDEPTLDRATPGFKVPKQVQLQWVDVRPSSEYFEKAAREQMLPVFQSLALMALPLGHSLSGAGPAVTLVEIAQQSAPNLPLLREYENYVALQKLWDREVEFTYRDSSFEQPAIAAAVLLQALASLGANGSAFETPITIQGMTTVVSGRAIPAQLVAGAIGQLLGSAGTDASLMAVPNTLSTYYSDEQTRRRKLALVFGLVGGSIPGRLPHLALAHPLLTEPLTVDQMKVYLTEKLNRQLARDLATGELNNLKKELTAHQKGKPKETQKWLSEELPKYHFTEHQTKQLHTQFNLETDPAIAPLKAAWLRDQPTATRDEADFAKTFFDRQMTLFQPQTMPQEWDPKWREADELIMYWVSEEKAPYVPPLDEETRKKVVEAWKMLQERQLAKAEADRLATEVRNRSIKGDDVRFLTELGAKDKRIPFSLNSVSKLEEPKNPAMSFQTNFLPYQVPKDLIRYPGPKFIDDLIEKLKTPGDVTVLGNQPENTYYVVVLKDRREPAQERFADVYKKASGPNSLWSKWVTDQHKEYRDSVVKELRIESGILDANGNPNYQVGDEFKRSLVGRTSEEE